MGACDRLMRLGRGDLKSGSINLTALADHPLRARIDAILGRLTALGVPEAHELEVLIQHGGARA